MVMTLVRKDFIYFIKSLKSTFVMTVIISLFMPICNVIFGVVIPSLACYVGFHSFLVYEDRSKMNLLNITLPVTRQEICLSKYIQMLIIILGSSLLSLCGMNIHKLIFRYDTLSTMNDIYKLIPIMLGSTLVYAAIVLPCVFKFGIIKARYVLMVIYAATVISVGFIGEKDKIIIIEKLNPKGVGTLSSYSIIIGIVAFIISYLISLKIWNKKEF